MVRKIVLCLKGAFNLNGNKEVIFNKTSQRLTYEKVKKNVF